MLRLCIIRDGYQLLPAIEVKKIGPAGYLVSGHGAPFELYYHGEEPDSSGDTRASEAEIAAVSSGKITRRYWPTRNAAERAVRKALAGMTTVES